MVPHFPVDMGSDAQTESFWGTGQTGPQNFPAKTTKAVQGKTPHR